MLGLRVLIVVTVVVAAIALTISILVTTSQVQKGIDEASSKRENTLRAAYSAILMSTWNVRSYLESVRSIAMAGTPIVPLNLSIPLHPLARVGIDTISASSAYFVSLGEGIFAAGVMITLFTPEDIATYRRSRNASWVQSPGVYLDYINGPSVLGLNLRLPMFIPSLNVSELIDIQDEGLVNIPVSSSAIPQLDTAAALGLAHGQSLIIFFNQQALWRGRKKDWDEELTTVELCALNSTGGWVDFCKGAPYASLSDTDNWSLIMDNPPFTWTVIGVATPFQNDHVASAIQSIRLSLSLTVSVIVFFVIIAVLFAQRIHQQAATTQGSVEAQERFMALTSHDMRTPIQIISSAATLGTYVDSLEEVQELLQSIRPAATVLAYGVQNIMDAHVESIQLSISSCDLRKVVLGAMNLVRVTAEVSPAVQVTVDVPEQVPLVLADGQRIRRCVMHLLTNAFEHTKSGEVRLHLDVEKCETLQQATLLLKRQGSSTSSVGVMSTSSSLSSSTTGMATASNIDTIIPSDNRRHISSSDPVTNIESSTSAAATGSATPSARQTWARKITDIRKRWWHEENGNQQHRTIPASSNHNHSANGNNSNNPSTSSSSRNNHNRSSLLSRFFSRVVSNRIAAQATSSPSIVIPPPPPAPLSKTIAFSSTNDGDDSGTPPLTIPCPQPAFPSPPTHRRISTGSESSSPSRSPKLVPFVKGARGKHKGTLVVDCGGIETSKSEQFLAVTIRVEDTGVGISPHVLKQIASRRSTAVHRGSGGWRGGRGGRAEGSLEIVKAVLEAMGSELQVKSKRGENGGTTATFRLALKATGTVSSPIRTAAASPSAALLPMWCLAATPRSASSASPRNPYGGFDSLSDELHGDGSATPVPIALGAGGRIAISLSSQNPLSASVTSSDPNRNGGRSRMGSDASCISYKMEDVGYPRKMSKDSLSTILKPTVGPASEGTDSSNHNNNNNNNGNGSNSTSNNSSSSSSPLPPPPFPLTLPPPASASTTKFQGALHITLPPPLSAGASSSSLSQDDQQQQQQQRNYQIRVDPQKRNCVSVEFGELERIESPAAPAFGGGGVDDEFHAEDEQGRNRWMDQEGGSAAGVGSPDE